jgi:hypothetical protein
MSVGVWCKSDRHSNLVVTVLGYRSRVPGSIPDATRIREK